MISVKKINQTEIANLNVKSVPGSRLKGTVQENKNVFDRLVEFVAKRINEILDILSTDGAANISVNVDGNTISLQEFANKPVYTKTEIEQILAAATDNLVKDVSIDLTDGVFKFTKKDGTIYQVDTAIEKIPATLEFVIEDDETYLKLTNQDGTITKTLVENLVKHYEFDGTGDISYTITPIGKRERIEGYLRNAVVKSEHLHPSALATFNEYVGLCATEKTGAQTAAEQAQISAAAAQNSANAAAAHEANCEAIKNELFVGTIAMIADGKTDILNAAAAQVSAAAVERQKAETAAAQASGIAHDIGVAIEGIISQIMEEVI